MFKLCLDAARSRLVRVNGRNLTRSAIAEKKNAADMVSEREFEQ
jgi:hypothetical protein